MLFDPPKCMNCGKQIEEDEQVYAKLRYPKKKGFTEIKAYLRNEAQFVCERCFEQA